MGREDQLEQRREPPWVRAEWGRAPFTEGSGGRERASHRQIHKAAGGTRSWSSQVIVSASSMHMGLGWYSSGLEEIEVVG